MLVATLAGTTPNGSAMAAVQLRTGREYGSGTLMLDALVVEAETGAAATAFPATPRDIITTTTTTFTVPAPILVAQPGSESLLVFIL